MLLKNKRILCILTLAVLSMALVQAQNDSYLSEMESYQDTQNARFSNPEKSPLTPEGLEHFEGLKFFPIDEKYRVVADLTLTPDASVFLMPTTTERVVEYRKYGIARFELDGKEYQLSIYQNQAIKDKEEYKDHLFLPFKDLTNGHGSYGGGRYIDLKVPGGNKIIIDFNKSYNPYCAYNGKYSCPVPPGENHLDAEIRAGVMNPGH
jgi:uncharacterized protein (DUF1684 family)